VVSRTGRVIPLPDAVERSGYAVLHSLRNERVGAAPEMPALDDTRKRDALDRSLCTAYA
jgi:hypothetical protein